MELATTAVSRGLGFLATGNVGEHLCSDGLAVKLPRRESQAHAVDMWGPESECGSPASPTEGEVSECPRISGSLQPSFPSWASGPSGPNTQFMEPWNHGTLEKRKSQKPTLPTNPLHMTVVSSLDEREA